MRLNFGQARLTADEAAASPVQVLAWWLPLILTDAFDEFATL